MAALISSLKGRQDSWKKKLNTLPEIEMLMANCILAAAITVYCGPMKTALRHKFFDSLQKVCQSQGFPAADQDLGSVLKLEDYSEFMLGKVKITCQYSKWTPLTVSLSDLCY